MIDLRLQIGTPWRREFFKNLGCLHGRITQNKAWELEHTYYSDLLVDFDFSIKQRQDHAGINLTLGIFGYGVSARIYDTRHWDYETDSWQVYNNS